MKGIQKVHALRFRDGGIIAKRFPCFACQHERLCDDCANAPRIGGVVVGQGNRGQAAEEEEGETADGEVVESESGLACETAAHVNDEEGEDSDVGNSSDEDDAEEGGKDDADEEEDEETDSLIWAPYRFTHYLI